MRKIYKRLLLVTVGSVGLLTACSNMINSSGAGGTTLKGPSEWMDQISQNALKKELAIVQEPATAASLLLKNEVGNVTITRSSDDNITVRTYIWAVNNDEGASLLEEVTEQAAVSIRKDGKQLVIQAHPRGDEKQDLWTWAEKNIGHSRFTVNYEIELPAAISAYDVSTTVGGITLDGLAGTYKVYNNVGKISIGDAQVQGKSTVKSDAGTIELDVNDFARGSSLKASAEVGSIIATLPSSLAYSLKTETDLGKVTGAAKGKSDINGGGPLLTLTTSVGFIKVEEK